jgi:hypothetical protein
MLGIKIYWYEYSVHLCNKYYRDIIDIEASAGGLYVPDGLYSPVAKYFGTCLEIRM